MALRRRREPDRIARTGVDSFAVTLPIEERTLLANLLPQLRELVTDAATPDASLDDRVRRLFPPAYASAEDGEHEREYQQYMREELVASRLAAIDDMIANLQATELSEPQLMAWMRSVNGVRLVLGTMLDVGEDDTYDAVDDQFDELDLYHYLSFLLEIIVQELQTIA